MSRVAPSAAGLRLPPARPALQPLCCACAACAPPTWHTAPQQLRWQYPCWQHLPGLQRGIGQVSAAQRSTSTNCLCAWSRAVPCGAAPAHPGRWLQHRPCRCLCACSPGTCACDCCRAQGCSIQRGAAKQGPPELLLPAWQRHPARTREVAQEALPGGPRKDGKVPEGALHPGAHDSHAPHQRAVARHRLAKADACAIHARLLWKLWVQLTPASCSSSRAGHAAGA